MFRERQLASIPYVAGQVSRARLPNDAVYHQLQFAIYGGVVTSTYTTGPTGPAFESNFPFSLMRDIRIIRNGSDVVWQGSGAQLAKEHYMLNNSHPKARLYTVATNVETLLTATSRGITIPATSDGIGMNVVQFVGASTASTTQTSALFDMQMEMWFQLNLDGRASTNTLVDARKLSTFDIEVTWADPTSIIVPGTNNTANTIACTLQVLSVDQDNVATNENFGTFKRSSFQYASNPYGSSGQQIMLARGNFWYGMILQTRAYKANSTTVLQAENNVLGLIQNRINTNFQLRAVSFAQLQSKNTSDNGGRRVGNEICGGPQGWAAIQYTSALDNPGEMIASYVVDVFDLSLEYQALSAASNGVTTASTLPVLDILTQEVIPGVTVSDSAPQGSQNGSIGSGSAKPYSR